MKSKKIHNLVKDATLMEPKKLGILDWLEWILGFFTITGGIGSLLASHSYGITTILAGLILFPPVNFFIKKLNIVLSRPNKIILYIVILSIGGLFLK